MKAIVTYALTNLFFLFAFITADAAPAAWPTSINRHAVAIQGDSVYLVKQGDTYYSLSRRFNIPLDSLQKWNDHKLQIGQTLYLSRKSMLAATAAKPKQQTAAPKSAQASKPAPATTKPAASTSASISPGPSTAEYKTKSRVMVIP
ncbi:MAG: LysM peptidoglycan-binding domain-containing protein, partial [Hymenobacteraceae bacterium]|nr:LysM peptidoglycan-binding domain-containing protein [Hymenobacteraceae bacterium]